MELTLKHALRLTPKPRVAFVGGGGKTTSLFHLARQLAPVIVCASTHLSLDQISQADQHFILDSLDDTRQLDGISPMGVILLTGPIEGERTRGLSGEIFSWLREFCDRQALPLLIEADGSRQRPLKAPAEYEPVIPDFVDHVIVVAGLLGVGNPLTSKWVHRPERFSSLSGLPLGEPITIQALARVLTHAKGGLRSIPPHARRIALLNQADTPLAQAEAGHLASILRSSYELVITASVGEGVIHAAHSRVAGVILAAGQAKRYGLPKQLLLWHGRPLIWHVANTALNSGLSPVVVVSGAYTSELKTALAGLPVEIVENTAWRTGQSSSVRGGIQALGTRAEAAVFLLADQPQIPTTLIHSLVDTHAQTGSPIIAPIIDGQRSNPVLFDKALFPDLKMLSGDVGGRQLFSRYKPHWLPWFDDRLLIDIDTPDDYQRLLDLA
ncbi:MAG: selenium cofactor biosynthesis protein YqeC [Chloroflexota bacterium]